MSLVLALACHDYTVHSKADGLDDPQWDTGPRFSEDLPADPPAQTCQELTLPEAVQVDESCFVPAQTGDLQTVVEWELTSFETYPEFRDVLMAPVVGDLTLDGVPDVVVMGDASSAGEVADNRQGVIRLLSGDDGREHWSVQSLALDVDGETVQVFPYRYSNAALGDIDGDGVGEIVSVLMALNAPIGENEGNPDTDNPQVDPHPPNNQVDTCFVGAWEADGSLKWVAWDPVVRCAGHAPLLADLDADGRVEAVVGNIFLDATDGTKIAVGDGGIGSTQAYADMGVNTVAGDLDGDGLQEVITGNTVYEHDATTRCSLEDTDGYPAIADLDGDGDGDVVAVGAGTVKVFASDCIETARWALSGGGNGGPPTIADFDADGAPEVGIADAGVYAVYEVDGTVLWSNPVTDESSHATGSAVFDFEGDGRPEVVYADETTLWIFDGASGTVRLQDDRHESRTLHELPTVVDVDGDGQAEIIVPNGGSHHDNMWWGLYVLGGANQDWVSGGTVWNQHAYSITNVRDDLSIPQHPAPNWPLHNNFRSGDLYGSFGGDRPEPTLRAEACSDECNLGRAILLVSVGNAGLGDLPPVEVVVRDSTGAVLETRSLPDAVPSGELTAPMRFQLPPGLGQVSVETRPLDVECDPDDEEKLWVELSCP